MSAAAPQGELFAAGGFAPTRATALARMAAVRPAAYARTRNHLDGDVTRLSPYLTHGLISLPEVLAGVLDQGPLPIQHKLVFELAWREYFRHVWLHEGEGILQSLHEGPRPDGDYSPEIPADVLQARTGVPAIDQAVRTLYASGYLHNHARMWLASYLVHMRKVHWRSGADWMFGYLLDGDLASNHLSWQWVAGTGSSKPYLFNAENVARYAPAEWHSAGSAIDTDYESLDALARSPRAWGGGGRAAGVGVQPPPLLHQGPAAGEEGALNLATPDEETVRGRDVQVVHPWSLNPATAGAASASVESATLRVGWLPDEFHQRWAWSAQRWQFVGQALQANCDVIWRCNAATLRQTLAAARSVHGTHDPHLPPGLDETPLALAPQLLRWPQRRCRSFFQFWTQATRGMAQAGELLNTR